jgi:Fe-S cluster assembly ATP-binding protein|tara:strand:+ start:180 stop:935 length:756 start_codon:yes stop_codon:yes gene_type:complete
MKNTLEIIDLHVSVESKPILKGVNLTVNKGETHAIMGPNGSGKSTLANTLMGHPKYIVDQGDILLDGESVSKLSPDKRAKKGLFLAFQYPHEVSGVSVFNFLRSSLNSLDLQNNSKPMSIIAFRKYLRERMEVLNVEESFVKRYLNEGFSGGEKKKSEILQMAVLKPKIAILDETDSGLDIDALKTVSDAVNKMTGPDLGILMITHYQRILKYVQPGFVHVLMDGKVVKSGSIELAQTLENKGYDWIRESL